MHLHRKEGASDAALTGLIRLVCHHSKATTQTVCGSMDRDGTAQLEFHSRGSRDPTCEAIEGVGGQLEGLLPRVQHSPLRSRICGNLLESCPCCRPCIHERCKN